MRQCQVSAEYNAWSYCSPVHGCYYINTTIGCCGISTLSPVAITKSYKESDMTEQLSTSEMEVVINIPKKTKPLSF